MLPRNLSEKKRVTLWREFTLVELLISAIIVVLLFVLALAVLGPARERARDAQGESDLRLIRSALEIKYHDNGCYPDLPDTLTDITKDDKRLTPYLALIPSTNGSKNYQWYDGGSNQRFCVLFEYEKQDGSWFTCGQQGCIINEREANCLGF